MTVLFFETNAQDKKFQNFKKFQKTYGCLIIPSDFEQKFEALLQEAFEKNLYLGTLKPRKKIPQQLQADSIRRENLEKRGLDWDESFTGSIDSLWGWLNGNELYLLPKQGISAPYPKKWIDVATAWAERLKQR